MTTVFWGNVHTTENTWAILGMPEPERLLPLLVKERTVTDKHYLTCPAFQEMYKNTFVVRSPVDLVITLDKNRDVFTDRYGQDFVENSIRNRSDSVGKDDPMLLSCSFNLLFVPDEDCDLEIIPATMHTTDFLKNTRVIGGRFNAHKWIRVTDFAFEVLDETKPLVLKRCDPLFYVRFTPRNGSKVSLEHMVITEDMQRLTKAVSYLKSRVPRLSFETMYKLAERLDISIFFKKKKKCPFNFMKRK